MAEAFSHGRHRRTVSYDVMIVGVAGMGRGARGGRRVLGIERYDIPHALEASYASAVLSACARGTVRGAFALNGEEGGKAGPLRARES